MKSGLGIIGVCAAIMFVGMFSTSYAFDNGDVQYWNGESVKVKFSEHTSVTVEEEFRFGENAGTMYHNHTDVGVGYRMNDYLQFGANYRQVFSKKGKDWDTEYRPHVNLTVVYPADLFTVKSRNRMEYRIVESHDDYFRYRNKFSLEVPLPMDILNFTPYVADEIYYDLDKGEMNKNRVYAGLKVKITANIRADIFYMRESSKSGKWKETNVFGSSLFYVF